MDWKISFNYLSSSNIFKRRFMYHIYRTPTPDVYLNDMLYIPGAVKLLIWTE